MELLTFLACFLLFLFTVAKVNRKFKQPYKLPPGPRPLPIIGNLHQVYGPLPHRIFADLAKKYGPLMHLKLGELSTVVVSSADAAKEIMKDHDIVFASRPPFLFSTILNYNCQDIAFAPYNNSWRQLRKICTVELLSTRRVQTFRPIREKEVMNMIKSISAQKGSVINLSKMVYSLTYTIIARSAFGKRNKYHDQYAALMDEVLQVMGGFSIVDVYPSVKILETITGMRSKLERLQKQVDEVFENVIREHKEKRSLPKTGNEEERDDLVDVLLNVQSSGEFGDSLTDNNIKGAIYDIFSAGGETSSKTVTWAMLEMLKQPAIFKRAQDEVRQVVGPQGNDVNESHLSELKYLRAVIKETLRTRPAAPLTLPRESSEECKIGGYVLPAKTRVIVNAFAICRDPTCWTDPDTFNPDRFLESEIDFQGKNFSYIPFGAGRRMCPGIAFSLPNMELPLAQMLYHFDWKLPGEMTPEDLDMTEAFALTVGPKIDLCLVPTRIYHLSALAV